MKRLCLAALILAASSMPAVADHGTADFTVTETVLHGNPNSRVLGGNTEVLTPCLGSFDQDVPPEVANQAQGLDGYWISLPDEAWLHDATLVANTADADFDAWFYDSGCNLMLDQEHARSMSSGLVASPTPNGDEDGTIPNGAKWVIVDLVYGLNAEFTFTVELTPGDQD